MQQPRKQPEPPVRGKSERELERERIYGEYDKAHPKELEITDPDDFRYYMDSDELKAHYAEKLAEDKKKGESFQDRAKATRNRLHARPEPEEAETFFDQNDVAQAYTEFRQRHPDITDADWKAMNDDSFILRAPDVVELRSKLNSSNSRADFDRLLERAADGYKTAKKNREDARYVEWMARQRSPRDDGELAKMRNFMKGAR
jgi:Xaa-Pro aminopeptidase